MKILPESLAAHLSEDVTTLCHCWLLSRRDGAILGFTDHDRDLTLDGTLCRAQSGFSASDIEAGLGLAVNAAEVAGAFSSEEIAADDVRAGLYDGARVAQFLVNWQDPSAFVKLNDLEIGDVSLAGEAFRVELRSPTHRLEQPQGRLYSHRCDALLGDIRCKVDLDQDGFRATAAVASVEGAQRLILSGINTFANGWFRNGLMTFLGGPLSGQSFDIEDHDLVAGGARIALWLPMRALPQAGDPVSLTIGCDKSFAMCRNRFANAINFQGFPHMPGEDFAYSYVDGVSEHDGRPIHD